MSTQRLERHYQKLLELFPQREALTTLQTLADALYCSKRHMRTLIIQMQSHGWLAWDATPGRGHLATLVLHYSQQQLMLAHAQRLLDLNDMRGALKLLGNEKHHLATLLRGRLGHRIDDEQQTLRIPYYRSMPNLYPGTALRRSEVHIIKQVFSGLTRIDENSGQVAKDVAHHWRRLDDLHWRFFLRPGVQFHDGTLLTSKDVVVSLLRSARLPLFSHLSNIEAEGNLSVMITLSQPDELLPQLLTDVAALILPADHQQRENFAARPVGTGPYKVADNNEWHLTLRAFDGYFGFRSLLDEIEIITCLESPTANELHGPLALLSSSMSDLAYVSSQLSHFDRLTADEIELETGGYFLLCDSRSPFWQKMAHRRWIREQIDPQIIIQNFVAEIRPLWMAAASILPGWSHHIEAGESVSPWEGCPLPQCLRLAYHHQHWEFPMVIAEFKKRLAASGVSLEVTELSYEAWASGEGAFDLWLGTVNFTAPEAWNVGAWLTGMPLLTRSVAGGDQALFENWQQQWRSGGLSSQQLAEIIIQRGWLQPLFHHWMRLQGPEQARGVHFNNLGWFDFTSTWIEPENPPSEC
ncbi:HTH-type transcriptional regulator SgrR [Pantoea cypripedii]|uniref:SgrR family transcriptional regulator n=1 Tax=Pantoea cypripedii TaxID=55209 RepID=A0A6B9GCV8_PANCY|nr:HTH-type transcriptional regulator SgrR [Pantoea cypripedii]QGY33290.1 SgrR family transcriptional regulator [Pantoea cypripedii]